MSELLKTAAREHKLAGKLAQIFVVSPQLELAAGRVADFIGLRFQGEQDALIKEVLTRALEQHKGASKQCNPDLAFLHGLFEHADRLYRRRHVAKKGEQYFVWLPMIESITQFETRHETMQIDTIGECCPDEITPHSAAFQLAARTLPGELFRLFLEDHDASHRNGNREAVAH
ncbi:hypothetical protein [Paraburkholderia domus]|uniref:hypothetical protein n=1 Tax=Paraburkholderia domus TaxID=2793075 RepID=UPI0019144545|nr:hypothetical protein [Paraburkholderia domus]MBK5065778.1 hypothetical protein [Burkholderia sp. R-70199]CAE6963018.1 hypothetical protein R70199_07465 [Paraburkholderia domus]